MATNDATRPPGPDGIPVLGSAVQFVRNPFRFRRKLTDSYGDAGVVYTEVGQSPLYLVTDPACIEEILATKNEWFIKPQLMRERLRLVFGHGLLLSDGEQWTADRELIQPSFYPEMMNEYSEVMASHAERTVERWSDGAVYDIAHEMERLSVEILTEALFGQSIKYESSAIGPAVRAISAKYDPTNPSWYVPNWVPTSVNRQYKKAVRDLDAEVRSIITDREKSSAEHNDLLSTLLEARNDPDSQMNDKLLRDEINTLLLGGSGPMGLVLTYTWYLLANNPSKRNRLHAELDDVLDGRVPTVTDLPELEYTERIIKEAMRLYPPVWTLGREAIDDVKIGDYVIPEGAAINLSPYSVHRDDRFYETPDEFRPDRWRDDREADRPNYAYFPFGGGPHRCIGKHFSLAQSQLVLAALAQEYRLEYIGEAPLDLTVSTIIEPEGPVNMRAVAR